MKLLSNLLFLFLSLFACKQSTNQVSNSPSIDLGAKMDSLYSSNFNADEPGAAVLLKKGDSTLFLKTYGLANLETRTPINENTVFNTGSISKTMVANGILLLHDEGKLSVEDPITKYFPDFKNPTIVKDIKLKHLLNHSSGLPDLRPVQAQREFYLTAKDAENFEPLKAVKKLNFPPGTQFEYSNPAYNALALIIEQVAGVKWQSFISSQVFRPAEMNKSKITDGPSPESGVAHAYVKNGNNYEEADYGEVPTFAAAGNGGIWSTVIELAQYEHALRSGYIISTQTVASSRTAQMTDTWTAKEGPFIGYSWFLGEELFMGQVNPYGTKIVYHTGSQGGFRAFYISIPEKDIFYVALFNRPSEAFSDFMTKPLDWLAQVDWLE